MPDLYTRIVAGVLFPLHEWVKGHRSLAVRRTLERTQWLSPAALRDLQRERLAAFVRNAYARVPYVQRLLTDHGLRPEQVQDVESLHRLPLMTKADVRSNIEALKARDARHLMRFNTGGSSGEPLIFYVGNERVTHDVAAKWRATRWWHVDIGDPEIVVWGSPIELGSQDRLRALRDRLLRTRLLPAFELSAVNLGRYIDAIREFRPRMLFGYPSSMALIATQAEATGIALNDLGIRVAFVTSERLYHHQQIVIERVFGCPVANGYGGRDAGFVAHACPQGSMHVSSEDIVVEVVDTDGRPLPLGEQGEIVVTHLATGDFPFIRYRTGDVGALDSEPCSCGRGLQVLGRLDGRTTDFVVAADGTVMHGLALIYVLRDIDRIDQFQIIQESLSRIVVRMTTAGDLPGHEREHIAAAFKRRLGGKVQVVIEQVDSIPREGSGKYRYVISKVSPQDVGVAHNARGDLA